MTSFYELYQAFQPDYDMFSLDNQSQLVLFTEKFEHQVEELEAKMAHIARGTDPYAPGVMSSGDVDKVEIRTDIGK